VRARPIRARDDQCGARACFPSSDVSGGEGKKPFRCFDRADAGSSGVFATRAFWICARVPSRQPNPQSGVNFFLSSPTLGGETETPHETRADKKCAANLPRMPVGSALGRYFEKRRTTARASGHCSRRANGGFRTAKRAARGFVSLGGGSTREKVRISVASARTPRAPSRNRRVSEDARFFSFRAVPRFAATAIRRRARAAGATKAPRRGASRATLMHAR
jgi:hypothetical protein